MICVKDLFRFGTKATTCIYEYLNVYVPETVRLDLLFKHRLALQKSLMTNVVDSDDEYFDSEEAALRQHPLLLS